jgi:hypothetical protein
MPEASEVHATARGVRLVHASLVLGQVLFAGVTYFTVRPNRTEATPLSDRTIAILLGTAFAACLLSLVLRRRVPARPRDVSADLYWTTAQPRAMLAWIPLEAAGLFALTSYFQTTDMWALGIAALPVALLVLLNPWVLERR